MNKVKLLKDSLHPNGRNRFRTFLISFPKCLLAELNTHRELVRNVGSSRAVPVTKMIERATSDPFIPIFTRNKRGMVGAADLTLEEQIAATSIWMTALENAVEQSQRLALIDVHKQETNRLLEPFLNVELVLSGTNFDNFYALRRSASAQPSFKEIADEMYEIDRQSTPDQLNYGDWHIPFSDYFPDNSTLEEKLKIAIARCARVSYQTHGGQHSVQKDFELYNMLLNDRHMSPFEHVAKVVDNQQDKLVAEDDWSIRAFLPDKLQDHLFWSDSHAEFVWTRQYAGFYTFRSHLEDNFGIN